MKLNHSLQHEKKHHRGEMDKGRGIGEGGGEMKDRENGWGEASFVLVGEARGGNEAAVVGAARSSLGK